MKRSSWYFLTFGLYIFLVACESDSTHGHNHSEATIQDNALQPVSNQEMSAELKAFHESMPPEQSIYLNVARSRKARKEAIGKPPGQLVQLMLRSTYEGILGGLTREALLDLDSLQQFVQSYEFANAEEILTKIHELKATGFLRQGEITNCINNHSNSSCIIPFSDEAIHTDKTGSEKAIEELEILLSKNPDDHIAKWMLNVAHMTLGTYPDGVPNEHLVPLTKPETPDLHGKMVNVAGAAGLDDNRLSGGVIAQDFNNDGLLDLFVSSWSQTDQVHLYINNGDGTFSNEYESWLLKGITGGLNTTSTDYNNDGWIDVFIPRGGWLSKGPPNSLLRNNGDGSFTDVTKEVGLLSYHPTQTAVWADFNNDGYVDLAIGNESSQTEHPCELYLGSEEGTFVNVAAEVGFNRIGYIKGLACADIDNDGDQDVFMSNMRGQNLLLFNEPSDNPHGFTFVDRAEQSNVTDPRESFPCWFFDYNNDGAQDLFVSGFSTSLFNQLAGEYAKYMLNRPYEAENMKLYRNDGSGQFVDVTSEVGLQGLAFTMGSNYGDLNNDGFLDFYLATGEPDLRTVVPNRMFLNIKGQRFEEVTTQTGTGHIQKGHAVTFADLDNDGDQDVYCVLGGAYEGDNFFNALFRNEHSGGWLKVVLQGKESNRAALGAIVTVTRDDGQMVVRRIDNSSSFGENPFQVFIGMDGSRAASRIEVEWPSGRHQAVEGVGVGKVIKLVEGANGFEELELPTFELKEGNGHHHHH